MTTKTTPRRRAPLWAARVGWCLLAAGAGATAVFTSCYEAPDVAPGAPVLLGIDLLDPTGMPISTEADGGVVPVSPRLSVSVRADRLLDPTPLEEITDAGPAGKTGVATFEAPGAPMAVVTYVPNGDPKHALFLPAGPRVNIAAVPTLPSGSTVTFRLRREAFRAKDGKTTAVLADGVADVVTFTTEAFAAHVEVIHAPPSAPADAGATEATDAGSGTQDAGSGTQDAGSGTQDAGSGTQDAAEPPPSADAGPTAPAPLTAGTNDVIAVAFNNLPAADIASHVLVSAIDGAGMALGAVAATVTADAADPAHLVVSPPAGGWPQGAQLSVTIDKGATDVLGIAIAEKTVVTIQVGAR